jgi:hypothetical protein
LVDGKKRRSMQLRVRRERGVEEAASCVVVSEVVRGLVGEFEECRVVEACRTEYTRPLVKQLRVPGVF